MRTESIDVRGAARRYHTVNEVTLYFDRPLTDKEMLSFRANVEKMLNKPKRK